MTSAQAKCRAWQQLNRPLQGLQEVVPRLPAVASARRTRSGLTDSALLDEALAALLARHREAELDATYEAYERHPFEVADEWGDLASFRAAAGAS